MGARHSTSSNNKHHKKQSQNNNKIYKQIDDLPTYEEIYGSTPPQDDNIDTSITDVFTRYDINRKHWNKLMYLMKFDIYIIGDDSGSMASPVTDGDNKRTHTRWDELLQMIKFVVDVSSVLDSDGITVSLLNGGTIDNVKSVKDKRYKQLISRGPNGGTPLVSALKTAIKAQKTKPLLIVIITDGEPSDGVEAFAKTIFSRDGSKVFISILACTDDDNAVGYLNGIDKDDATLDVLDDYRSEHAEVLKAQGPTFRYSQFDHFTRVLLGPVHPKYDKLDEYKVSMSNSIDDASDDKKQTSNSVSGVSDDSIED